MNRTPKKWVLVVQTIVAILIAIYVLYPFFMVLINSAKTTTGIGNDPVTFAGANIGQLIQNIHDVVHNSHFNFWWAFGSSVVITVISRPPSEPLRRHGGLGYFEKSVKPWASAIISHS